MLCQKKKKKKSKKELVPTASCLLANGKRSCFHCPCCNYFYNYTDLPTNKSPTFIHFRVLLFLHSSSIAMFGFPFRLLFRRPYHRRHLHSTPTQPLQLPLSHPIYLIWGSNTAVGKTLVSAGIAASHLLSSHALFHYIKPVQTGFPIDSDSRFVFNKVSELFLRRNPSFSLFASNLILNASGPASNAAGEIESCAREMSVLNWREEKKLVGEGNGFSELICKTMYAWEEAVSPHLAAERESGTVKDSMVLETLHRCFRDVLEGGAGKGKSEVLCVIETAGGVASPGPSGSLQCDLYRYCFYSYFS